MVCPNDSTLTGFCIGGQLQTGCDDAGLFGQIDVTVRLVCPTGGHVTDPTSGAMVVGAAGGIVHQSVVAAGGTGCWCTCELWPNVATDPDLALQPSCTYYLIELRHNGDQVPGSPFQIQLNADLEYETETYECGDCVPLRALLPLPITSPPTATFCDAVEECETAWTGLGGVGVIVDDGDSISGRPGNGHQPSIRLDVPYVLSLIPFQDCDDVTDCLGPITTGGNTIGVTGDHQAGHDLTIRSLNVGQIATNGTDGGVLVTGEAVVDAVLAQAGPSIFYVDGSDTWGVSWGQGISTDAGQVLALGGDGKLKITCEAIQDCVGTMVSDGLVYDDAANTLAARISGTAGNQVSISAGGLFVPAPVVTPAPTTDGTATGVTGSNAAGYDFKLRSTAAGQILTTGADGGVFLNAEATQDAVGAIMGDGLAYDDAGNSIDVLISGTAGNVATISAGGVFVPTPTAAPPVPAPKTDGTATGVAGSDVAGYDLKLRSTVAGQILTTAADGGVYLSAEATQDAVGAIVGDGLAYDDAGNSIDVVISGTAGNQASISAGGVFVPAPAALDCDDVVACLGDLTSTDGSATITGGHAAGWDIEVTPPAEPPGARAARATGFSIPGGTETLVEWDSNEYDSGTIQQPGTNPGRFTAPVDGKYLVQAGVEFFNNAFGYRRVRLKVNGSTVIATGDQHTVVGAIPANVIVSTEVELTAGQWVGAYATQSSGSPLNATSSSWMTMRFQAA